MKIYKLRYARQMILPDIGVIGQRNLRRASVLCIGIGGLGIPAVIYLAAAGVGILGIMDNDIVDISNLHRQVIFSMDDIGKNKVRVAEKFLKKFNPDLIVHSYEFRLSRENAYNIMKNYDIIIDCTDNLDSKFLINFHAMSLSKPMVYGAIYGFEGYVSVFHNKGACYSCLYRDISNNYLSSCVEHGVLGVIAGIIGNMQALEAIKLILNNYDGVNNRFSILLSKLMVVNCKNLSFNIICLKKKKSCIVCNNNVL